MHPRDARWLLPLATLIAGGRVSEPSKVNLNRVSFLKRIDLEATASLFSRLLLRHQRAHELSALKSRFTGSLRSGKVLWNQLGVRYREAQANPKFERGPLK